MINAIFKAKASEDSDELIEINCTVTAYCAVTKVQAEQEVYAVAINNETGQMFSAPVRFFIAQKSQQSRIETLVPAGG